MLDMQEWWWLWLLTAWLWGVIVGFLLYLGIERTPKNMVFKWFNDDPEPAKPEAPKPEPAPEPVAQTDPPVEPPKPPERQPGLRDIVAETAKWIQEIREPVKPPQPEPPAPIPEPEPAPEPEPDPVAEYENPTRRLASGILAWVEIGGDRWISGESIWKIAIVRDGEWWRVEFNHGEDKSASLQTLEQARQFVRWVLGS